LTLQNLFTLPYFSLPLSIQSKTKEQYSYIKNCIASTFSSTIPIVDLSKPIAKILIVNASEEFGFFKNYQPWFPYGIDITIGN